VPQVWIDSRCSHLVLRNGHGRGLEIVLDVSKRLQPVKEVIAERGRQRFTGFWALLTEGQGRPAPP
jgi:hypothetical protein